MKSKRNLPSFYLFVCLTTIGALISGCSSSTQPSTTTNSNQLQIKSNATVTYYQYQTDPSTGSMMAGTGDTITQKKITSDSATIQGKAVLAAFEDTHSNGATKDTVYYSQDAAGNFYVLDFGAETINIVAASLIGSKVRFGWVLIAEMQSPAGTQWIGVNNPNVPLGSYPAASVVDSATIKSDTTILVGSENVKVKHATHSLVTADALAGAAGTIDTYVSADLGAIVLNNIHPAHGTGLLPSGPYQGIYKIMLTHN